MIEARQTATRIARRDFIVGGICIAGAAASNSLPLLETAPQLPVGGLARLVPQRIGAWRIDGAAGVDGIIVAQDAREQQGRYDDLLTRIYRAGNAPPITLLVAYGSSQMDVWIHRPEACYPAAGFALGAAKRETLTFGARMIVANAIHAQSLLRNEWLLYWTRIGSRFPISGAEQRAAVFRENLAGRIPDGILVRVSTPESDERIAVSMLRRFLADLYAGIGPVGARLLFGR